MMLYLSQAHSHGVQRLGIEIPKIMNQNIYFILLYHCPQVLVTVEKHLLRFAKPVLLVI